MESPRCANILLCLQPRLDYQSCALHTYAICCGGLPRDSAFEETSEPCSVMLQSLSTTWQEYIWLSGQVSLTIYIDCNLLQSIKSTNFTVWFVRFSTLLNLVRERQMGACGHSIFLKMAKWLDIFFFPTPLERSVNLDWIPLLFISIVIYYSRLKAQTSRCGLCDLVRC